MSSDEDGAAASEVNKEVGSVEDIVVVYGSSNSMAATLPEDARAMRPYPKDRFVRLTQPSIGL